MNSPSTIREALLAETIDEVVRLHDHVKALPEALARASEGAAARNEIAAHAIVSATAGLIAAGNAHQSRIAEYVERVAVPRINDAVQQATATPQLPSQPQHELTEYSPASDASRRSLRMLSCVALLCFLIGMATGWWMGAN